MAYISIFDLHALQFAPVTAGGDMNPIAASVVLRPEVASKPRRQTMLRNLPAQRPKI
jgi:hypothetical protein